ncbi:MAG: hypothetical protein AAF645_26090 [Myxococcota bacterium]
MKTRLLSLALALAAGATASSADAQAWIRDPGSVYVNLGYRTIGAERFYAPDGSRAGGGDIGYRQHSIALYAEAGIVDRWLMATVDGEIFRRNRLRDQGATTGLGDLRVGLWTGLLEGPVNLSFGVLVGLPTGDPVPQGDDEAASNIAVLLPTGDGEWDVTPTFALGYGFGWLRVQQFVQATAGYSIRTTPREAAFGEALDIRDQFHYRLETGIRIDRPVLDRFWFILRFAGQVTVQERDLEDGALRPRQGAVGLGDAAEFHSVGLETLFDIYGGFGMGFGVDGAFAARNVPAGAAVKLSLTYEHR